MKRNLLSITVVAFSMALTTACLQTRSQIEKANEKKILKEQLSTIQSHSASQTAKFNEIEGAFRALNGRIEVVESQLQQMEQKSGDSVENWQSRIQNQEKKINALESALEAQDKEIRELRGNLKALAAGSKPKTSQKTSYQTAEDYFKQKNWKKAALAYKRYRELNPKGSRVAMATYKIGVSFEEMGEKDVAKAFYQEVADKYGKSKAAKYARSRLKKLK